MRLSWETTAHYVTLVRWQNVNCFLVDSVDCKGSKPPMIQLVDLTRICFLPSWLNLRDARVGCLHQGTNVLDHQHKPTNNLLNSQCFRIQLLTATHRSRSNPTFLSTSHISLIVGGGRKVSCSLRTDVRKQENTKRSTRYSSGSAKKTYRP